MTKISKQWRARARARAWTTGSTSIRVARVFGASPARVWAVLEPVEAHGDWMRDAAAIAFDGTMRRGVGTRIRVVTKVGPLRLIDHMTFTEWTPPGERDAGAGAGDGVGRMGVAHTGIVTGEGVFTLEPMPGNPNATRFTWTETLRFPARLGGPVAAPVGRAILTAIWRRNLTALAQLVAS